MKDIGANQTDGFPAWSFKDNFIGQRRRVGSYCAVEHRSLSRIHFSVGQFYDFGRRYCKKYSTQISYGLQMLINKGHPTSMEKTHTGISDKMSSDDHKKSCTYIYKHIREIIV